MRALSPTQPLRRARRAARCACLTLICAASAFGAGLPEPNVVLFGTGSNPLPAGTLVEARVGADVVAGYLVGSIPDAGATYLLQVPVETPIEAGQPRTGGVARLGDLLQVFLNGVDSGEAVALTERGMVARLDVEVDGDISAPTPPTLASSSHTPGTWSNLEQVDLTWSGAADDEGLAGYSVVNDRFASTSPDTVVEILHGPDPHELTIGPLDDADDHYFHLRVCDVSSNCSGAIHAGPFLIDATAPSAPGDIAAAAEGDGTVSLVWIAATDGLSGIEGYAVELTREGEEPTCDETIDATGITSTSDPLGDGEWFASVCASDRAGNWGPLRTEGPVSVERLPPVVVHVGSVGALPDATLDEGDAVEVPVTQILLTFSEPMRDPGGDAGADDVTNPANYLLVEEGADPGFQTTDCAAGAAAGDLEVPITSVTYDEATFGAALRVGAPSALPSGRYRLAACAADALRDLSGKALDGDGDETGGDDFWLELTVSRTHLLENPNFDDGTDPWTFSGSATAGPFWSEIDGDGAPSSGSGEIAGAASGADLWSLSQCIPVEPSSAYRLVVAAEIESGAGEPSAHGAVEIFASADCTGAPLVPAFLATGVHGDTAGDFVLLEEVPVASGAASSARISLVVSTEAGVAFEVRFDGASFSEQAEIFSDGFESGTLSAWSSGSGAP